MQAHPMILPHVGKDAPELSALSVDARKVFDLLYDLVDGYASDAPTWSVERWTIALDQHLYGCERISAMQSGWRAIASLRPLPPPDAGLPRVEQELADGAEVEVVAHSVDIAHDKPMTLGEFIVHMEQSGLGRPSTYAAHAQALLDKGWIADASEVELTGKARDLHARLVSSEGTRYDADFTRAFLLQLDAIENGSMTPAQCLNAALDGDVDVDASILEWIDQLEISGDAAQVVYEAREQLDRTTVAWQVGRVPAHMDPELALSPEAPERALRAEINQAAAAGTGQAWQACPMAERVNRRIEILAARQGLGADAWRTENRFNVLSRWLVGWVLEA